MYQLKHLNEVMDDIEAFVDLPDCIYHEDQPYELRITKYATLKKITWTAFYQHRTKGRLCVVNSDNFLNLGFLLTKRLDDEGY